MKYFNMTGDVLPHNLGSTPNHEDREKYPKLGFWDIFLTITYVLLAVLAIWQKNKIEGLEAQISKQERVIKDLEINYFK